MALRDLLARIGSRGSVVSQADEEELPRAPNASIEEVGVPKAVGMDGKPLRPSQVQRGSLGPGPGSESSLDGDGSIPGAAVADF